MTLRGAEPAVAFEAWLAALAARGLERAAAGRARAARRRRRPRARPRRWSRWRPNPPHRCAAMDGYAVVAARPATALLRARHLPADRHGPAGRRSLRRRRAGRDRERERRRAARRACARAAARTCVPRARTCSEGDALLPAGRLLSSYDIALAAVAGHGELERDAAARRRDPADGRRAAPARDARSRPARSPMPTARCCRRSRATAGALCERLPPRPDDAAQIGAAVLGRRAQQRPRARDRGLLARPRRPHGVGARAPRRARRARRRAAAGASGRARAWSRARP